MTRPQIIDAHSHSFFASCHEALDSCRPRGGWPCTQQQCAAAWFAASGAPPTRNSQASFSRNRNRLEALALLPQNDLDAAIEEAVYAFNALGLDGMTSHPTKPTESQ